MTAAAELDAARAALRADPLYALLAPRVEQWLADVARADPQRLLWHARRLRGFGGSETGTLVANRRGAPGDFGESARHVIERKLLLAPVRRPTADQRRGLDMEPLIQHHFMTQFASLDARRDEAAYQAIATGVGPLPYLRYSPDDVAVLGGRRYLIDYKSPTQVDLMDDGSAPVMFGYGVQLHTGRLVAQQQGVPIDGMLLVQWDIKRWMPVVTEVEHDPALGEEIVEACRFYRDVYWTRGVPPPPFDRPAFDLQRLPAETSRQIAVCASRFALLGSAAARLTEAQERERAAALALLHGYRLTDKARLDLPDVSVSMSPAFDIAGARQALQEQQVPAAAIEAAVREPVMRKKQPVLALDPAKLERVMRERGIDPAEVMSAQMSESPERYRQLCQSHGIDPSPFEAFSTRWRVAAAVAERVDPETIADLLRSLAEGPQPEVAAQSVDSTTASLRLAA